MVYCYFWFACRVPYLNNFEFFFKLKHSQALLKIKLSDGSDKKSNFQNYMSDCNLTFKKNTNFANLKFI
jgi:hypothetical protein